MTAPILCLEPTWPAFPRPRRSSPHAVDRRPPVGDGWIHRLRLGRALRLLCLFAALVAPALRAEVVLSVQLNHQPGYQNAGYYVALMRGYYRDAGLDVDLRAPVDTETRTVERVVRGVADFGVTGSTLLPARLRGEPVVALAAIGQRFHRTWVARQGLPRTGAGIPDLRFIDPRRIAWRGEVSTAWPLLMELSRWGVDWKDVAPQVASQNELEARFAHGEFDLIAFERVDDAERMARLAAPSEHLSDIDQRSQGYSEVLFTREDFARDHPQQVERFLAATLRGWEEALTQIEPSARLVQSRFAPDVPLDRLVAQGKALAAQARLDEIELGHMSERRWRRIAAELVPMGLGGVQDRVAGLVWRRDTERAPSSPDPVRWSQMAVIVALWLALWALWRHGVRAHGELATLRSAQQNGQEDDLRFQFLMDVAPFPVLMFGLHDGVIAYANERAIGTFELGEGAGAQRVQDALPALAPGQPLMSRLQSRRILREVELERPGRGGSPSRWSLLTMRAVEFEGRPCAFAAAIDISRRKQAELELEMLSAQRGRIIEEVEQLQSKLRDASVRDPLTGLFNRRYLEATLKRELHRASREGTPLAMLVVDADHFKRINDHYGHAGGDEVLRALAGVLNDSHRTEDVVCRYGGEEFVVVLPGSNLALAQQRAEDVRTLVAQLEIATDAGFATITVSIGLATRRPDEDADALFKRADAAVYAAKAQGRNRVVVAEGEPWTEPRPPLGAPPTDGAAGRAA